MTLYRGGLSKGNVIAANKIIAQKAAARSKVKIINVPKIARKDDGKRLMWHKKAMVKRYTHIYGSTTHQCIYCGKWIDAASDKYTMEHLVPLSAGGSNNPENHHPACLDCNHDKAQLMLDEWLNVLRRRYDECEGLNAPLVYIIMRVEYWLIFAKKNKEKLFKDAN